MSGGHGHDHSSGDKRIGLAISVLALCLAVAEIMGQKAQTQTLQSNIEASNLWSFFQAKTIRRTTLETAADQYPLLQIFPALSPQRYKELNRLAEDLFIR